jgi:hypothetical protein
MGTRHLYWILIGPYFALQISYIFLSLIFFIPSHSIYLYHVEKKKSQDNVNNAKQTGGQQLPLGKCPSGADVSCNEKVS